MVDTAQRSAPTASATPTPAAPNTPAAQPADTFTPIPAVNVAALSRQLLGSWRTSERSVLHREQSRGQLQAVHHPMVNLLGHQDGAL